MKNIISVIGLLLLTQPAFSSRVGNGGFAIKCNNQIELYDYFAAKENGLNISPPGSATYTYENKIEDLLLRLQKMDPNRAKMFRYLLQNGWSKAFKISFLDIQGIEVDSTQVQDPVIQKNFGLGQIQIPKDCKLFLVAQQRSPSDGEYTVQIFRPSWNLLDETGKAALILHELFYREAIDLEHTDSVGVRALNGLLASKESELLDAKQWILRLAANNFPPMFPDFESKDNTMNPDSIYKSVSGNIDICNQKIPVDTEGIHIHFLNGLFPEQAYFTRKEQLDLSCYSKKYPLIVQVIARTQIRARMTDTNNKSIYALERFWPDRDKGAYLLSYLDPNIKFSGMVKVDFHNHDDDPRLYPHVYLIRTEFAILQVLEGGKWVHKDQIKINLNNGELVNEPW